MDFSVLGKDDKNRALLQIELDSGKQRKMFESIIGEPAAVIVDVLIRELQSEINKDTLWRLFGDVIYSNIEANVNGTKICVKCKERFLVTNNRAKYCENCYREVNRTNALTRYYA